MKRGAKICVLGVVAIVATAVMTFLLMHVSLVTVTSSQRVASPPLGMRSPHVLTATARDQQQDDIERHLLRDYDGQGSPRNGPADAATNDVVEARIHSYEAVDRSDTATEDSIPTPTTDCGVDRSFAPQCVGVSPKAWQLHRTVQAVGRMTIDNTDCSGTLLGNTTSAYFLTAARCLPWEGMAKHARIELTNCIGSQVFTRSEVVHMNRPLDFVVLRLDTRGFNVAGHFGFLRLRSNGPATDEVVFAAHYTDSYAKRITIANDQGLLHIQHTTAASDTCSPAEAYEPTSLVQFHAAHLDDAAVGAPVISLSDYVVVALNLCSACIGGGTNTALSTKSIIDDLNTTGHLFAAFVAKT